jgi:serine/threonine protein kinase
MDLHFEVQTHTPYQIGARIGNYCLQHILKRGVNSTIYLGEHIHLHTRSVVKVLNHWAADKQHIDNFCAEAQLHSSLHHPHIVRVLDFGLQDDVLFLVMDYSPRGSLHDHFPNNMTLPFDLLLPFVKQITQALQYIHDRGLIHRDIKPQNILLSGTKNVLLSDFGIAVVVQPWDRTRSTSSFGTALYAAPEQIEGKPLVASDQYSLAILIYNWLCGQPPFKGNSLQLCKQHLYSEVPPLRDFSASIPSNIECVIMRALSKDPSRRYPSVSDFTDALQAAADISWVDATISINRALRLQHQGFA